MIDLEQQIHSYYEAITDPVDIEAVTALDSASARNDGSWWRGPLIAIAAAAVVVVAISAAAVVLRGGPDTAVKPTTETVAPAPEITVPPTTLTTDEDRAGEISGLSFEWTRIRLPGIPFDEADPFDGMVELTVAVFDGGLVVTGGDHVWMSSDGVNWPMTATLRGHVRDLFAGGPGLVAVTAGSAAGTGPPQIWTSTDGITWTPADLDGSTGGTLRAVTGRGTDLVAVGYGLTATSSDGVTWTGTSPGGPVWMHDVTVGGPGFVAVGGSENDGWSAAWTSKDGITWSKQSFGPTSGSWTKIEMKAVTTGGPGFVAVGHGPSPAECPQWPDCTFVGSRRAWVWTSPDGFAWTQAPGDEAAFENSTMNDVTAYGETLVAVGGTEGTGEDAIVWTSTDGITWQQLPHDDLFDWWGMSSVVRYGDKLVAAGGDSVWIGTPQPSDESTP